MASKPKPKPKRESGDATSRRRPEAKAQPGPAAKSKGRDETRAESGNGATAKSRTKSAKAGGKAAKAPSKPDSKTRFTINHRVIRSWAEERQGKPATVRNTRRKGDAAGILRIDFPGGASDPPLKPISWDEFFSKFDETDLAFLYQKQTAGGEISRFNKFVSMGTAVESDAIPVKGPEGEAGPEGARQDRAEAGGVEPEAKKPARPKARSHKAKTTTNRRTIQRWAEERQGKPATVRNTRRKGDEAGILRIDIPGGAADPPLKEITWDEFFAKFEEAGLLFLYQETTSSGEISRFCKFIARDDEGDGGR